MPSFTYNLGVSGHQTMFSEARSSKFLIVNTEYIYTAAGIWGGAGEKAYKKRSVAEAAAPSRHIRPWLPPHRSRQDYDNMGKPEIFNLPLL